MLALRLRIQILQLHILNLNPFTPAGGSATLHQSDLVVIDGSREVVHRNVRNFESAAVAVAGRAAERRALRDGESGAADAGEGEVCEGDVADVCRTRLVSSSERFGGSRRPTSSSAAAAIRRVIDLLASPSLDVASVFRFDASDVPDHHVFNDFKPIRILPNTPQRKTLPSAEDRIFDEDIGRIAFKRDSIIAVIDFPSS